MSLSTTISHSRFASIVFFYWHKILVEMDVCIQETLENLKGSYEDDRVATMAVSIGIKKELEAKLYPSYADGCV